MTHEIHLLADILPFFWIKMKLNLALLPPPSPESLWGVNKQPFIVTQTQKRIIAASVWQTLLRLQNAPCY